MSEPTSQDLLSFSTLLGITHIHGFKSDVTPVPNLVLPDEVYDDSFDGYYRVNFLGDRASVWISPASVTFKEKGITSLVLPKYLEEIFQSKTGLVEIEGKPGHFLEVFEGLFLNNNIGGELIIPETVVKIAKETFKNNLIESLTFLSMNNLEELGISSFKNNKISSINLPASLTKIPESAFEDNLLEDLILPENISIVEDFAFKNNKIKTLQLPDSLTDINASAFESNELTEIILPKNLKNIRDSSFKNNSITKVILPDSIRYVGVDAFSNNPLELVIISSLASYIRGEAFREFNGSILSLPHTNPFAVCGDSCFGDDYILYRQENSSPYVYDEYFQNIKTIPNLVSDEDLNYTISNIDGEDYVVIHGFSSGVNLSKVTFPREIEGISKIIIDEEAFKNKGLTKVCILDSVYEIRNKAFEDNLIEDLNTVFALNLKIIGDYAFNNNVIEEVDLSNNSVLEYIGLHAFYGSPIKNPYLVYQYYQIQGFVENLPERFKRNLILPSIHIDEEGNLQEVRYIRQRAFKNEPIKCVYISHSIKSIPREAFKNVQFNHLYLTEGLLGIGESAFRNCGLTSINLPNSLKSLGLDCFAENEFKGSDLIIHDNITSMNYSPFRDGYFHTVTIGEGITTLYRICDGIKYLKLGSNVKTISSHAFAGVGLNQVELNEGLEEIGGTSFGGNNLFHVEFPSTIKTIGSSAFKGNKLTIINLPNGLEELSPRVFEGNRIKWVNKPEFLSIIESGVFNPNEIKSIYIPGDVKTLNGGCLSSDKPMHKHIQIDEGVEVIDSWVFFNTRISSVILPSTLTKYGGFNFCEYIYDIYDVRYTTAFDELIILAENPPEMLDRGHYEEGLLFGEDNIDSYPSEHIKIKVPYQSVNLYKNDEDWSIYSRFITHISGPVHPSILDYEVIDNKICIHGFNRDINFIDHLELPDKIEGLPVELISENAFKNCSFSSVVLPRYLKIIENFAFYNDGNYLIIKSLSFNPPVITSSSFNNISYIYVHKKSLENYKEALVWKDSKNKIGPLEYNSVIKINEEEDLMLKDELIEGANSFKLDVKGNLFCVEFMEKQDSTKITQDGNFYSIGEVIEKWQD